LETGEYLPPPGPPLDMAVMLCALRYMHNLESLEISKCNILINDALLVMLGAYCPKLKSLTFSSNPQLNFTGYGFSKLFHPQNMIKSFVVNEELVEIPITTFCSIYPYISMLKQFRFKLITQNNDNISNGDKIIEVVAKYINKAEGLQDFFWRDLC